MIFEVPFILFPTCLFKKEKPELYMATMQKEIPSSPSIFSLSLLQRRVSYETLLKHSSGHHAVTTCLNARFFPKKRDNGG